MPESLRRRSCARGSVRMGECCGTHTWNLLPPTLDLLRGRELLVGEGLGELGERGRQIRLRPLDRVVRHRRMNQWLLAARGARKFKRRCGHRSVGCGDTGLDAGAANGEAVRPQAVCQDVRTPNGRARGAALHSPRSRRRLNIHRSLELRLGIRRDGEDAAAVLDTPS